MATIAWTPFATRDESQGSVTWLPPSLAVASVVSPIDSVKVRVPSAAPSTQMSDHTTPPTVAPAGRARDEHPERRAVEDDETAGGGPEVTSRVEHRRDDRLGAIGHAR